MSVARPPDEDLVAVGRIVKPHGIRGEVAVAPLSDRPERFESGVVLWVGDRRLEIVASRPHQGRVLLRLVGVEDRTRAERLRGAELLAVRDELDVGEVYLADELLGLAVHDADGRALGRVAALVELPEAAGYDLLEVVREDGSAWLLPASEEIAALEEVDGELHIVLTSPPEGLVDDLGGGT